jgi:hypothetical protein
VTSRGPVVPGRSPMSMLRGSSPRRWSRRPPENALVLCVDEKSQIQALNRTAPCLPMLPTTPARMTHDYVRNGTTSLFAAFDLASGSVIAQHSGN